MIASACPSTPCKGHPNGPAPETTVDSPRIAFREWVDAAKWILLSLSPTVVGLIAWVVWP